MKNSMALRKQNMSPNSAQIETQQRNSCTTSDWVAEEKTLDDNSTTVYNQYPGIVMCLHCRARLLRTTIKQPMAPVTQFAEKENIHRQNLPQKWQIPSILLHIDSHQRTMFCRAFHQNSYIFHHESTTLSTSRPASPWHCLS